MKKLLRMLLIMTLVLSASMSSAMAFNFTLVVSTTDPVITIWPHSELKTDTSHTFYLRHTVFGGSNAYTNLFHILQDNSGSYLHIAQKWCTPGLNIPISGGSRGQYYTIGARGNTKHFELDGVSSVTLSGTFAVNQE